MNIQPNYDSVSMRGKNWNSITDRIMQKILDAVPTATAKESAKKLERWKKTDDVISRPAQNRGILGATALITQPAIDYYNHRVDEETRTVSRNRTIAKIVAGTAVGMFVVRGPIYKAIVNMTDLNGKSKLSKALIPKSELLDITKNPKFLKNYRSALSMLIALLAMSVTNFVLDAPLTVYLTNMLNDKTLAKKDKGAEQNKDMNAENGINKEKGGKV